MKNHSFGDEFEEDDSFLRRYGVKMNKVKGMGNFVSCSNGDITSARSSSPIVSAGFAVIPEPRNKNKGVIQRKNKVKSRFKAPDEKSLPKDHCVLSFSIPPSAVGMVLGYQHSSIKKMTNKCPGTYYVVKGSIITVWGLETNAKRLIEDIKTRVNEMNSITGPPVPEEKLPPGQCKRRILIANYNIGHVLGKGKQNLVQLRDENPTASINFNSKTGEMYVFGETTGVNKVCDDVALMVDTAKQRRAKENAWEERVGKASHDKKIEQYEKDMHAFQMAVSLQDKQKQEATKETAEVAATLKKMQDKAAANLCQKQKEQRKQKNKQKKKQNQQEK